MSDQPVTSQQAHLRSKALWGLFAAIVCSLYISLAVPPKWQEQLLNYDVYPGTDGQLVYMERGKEKLVGAAMPYVQSPLRQKALDNLGPGQAVAAPHWVTLSDEATAASVRFISAQQHFGFWSLLPAFVAILLCLLTREPLTSLLAGVIVGAFMLSKYDVANAVLIPSLSTNAAATILVLYLWLLGGLLGVWSKTGAAAAFAATMATHFVRGPRSAKLVAWGLGVIFFQGGTISTVLVGTTVKPLADKQQVSHEELSYIVDSTSSPIASVLAFNAWPAYIQALIFIPGVAFLSTEEQRIGFFFDSVPLSFYGILAVLGTLLLSLDITRFSGNGMRAAMHRARDTGALDSPHAQPLASKQLADDPVPAYYMPNMLEFLLPLLTLIAIAIVSFIVMGTPQVIWAFASALLLSITMAAWRGMTLRDLVDGFGEGLKSVVFASVILMLAITIGAISKETGGGTYLVGLLGDTLPYWLLPLCLLLLTMVTAFSTGSSWGTYAIAFPLAMPLAWAIAQNQGLQSPELYLSVCFACVLNGSVFGDQCSPVSDTTVLSAMTTGCDLMDHVKTQIVPASLAMSVAASLWTIVAITCR